MKKIVSLVLIVLTIMSFTGCETAKKNINKEISKQIINMTEEGIDLLKAEPKRSASYNKLANLKYKGKMTVVLNNNEPSFNKKEKKNKKTYMKLRKLDSFGRCKKVDAVIGPKTLAKEERGSIGMFKPSGWHTVRYNVVGKGSSGYLYNRCHLLAFCLYGNSTNDERNLITGTRQFNAGDDSMLTYELKTVKYIENTGNHVRYRVTPIFKGKELVARGVKMEGYSIEDKGKLKFNVFIHNHQDGITIDYKTGESKADNGERAKGAYAGY